ncbi:MAG: AAA family ATPase, partial [Clostridiales bacterium]|nr:AAA family ATPase [Clostridiales bacterium]
MNPQHWEEHIAAGNVPHAILLAGNRGTGKKAFARRLATRYLGLTGETALTNCPYYTETADYAVENVRNISRAVNLQAYGRGRRCVVFFDAHNLTAQAQNALLKSLEEPPDDTLFLLTGNEAGLLPTVRSRCMTLRFGAKPVA